MTNQSIKLAQLWISLMEIKDKLDNEIIPVSGHLELDDPELIIAMEELSEKVNNHFEKFKLIAETKQLHSKKLLKRNKIKVNPFVSEVGRQIRL